MWDRGRYPGLKAASEIRRLGSGSWVQGRSRVLDSSLDPGCGTGCGVLGSRPDRVSEFDSQSLESRPRVEWSRPWCGTPAVVLSLKKGAGCWAGARVVDSNLGGTA